MKKITRKRAGSCCTLLDQLTQSDCLSFVSPRLFLVVLELFSLRWLDREPSIGGCRFRCESGMVMRRLTCSGSGVSRTSHSREVFKERYLEF